MVAVVLTLGASAPSAAQDGAPRLEPLEAPAALRAGGSVRVEAHAERVEVCQLRVSGAAVSTVKPRRATEISWTWAVPADAREVSWDGDVFCWTDEGDAGRERPDVERSFEIAVDGAPDGTLSLIEPGSLTVEVSEDETDPRPWLERAADWGQLGTLAATVIGVLLVLLQIRAGRRQQQSTRTGQAFDQLRDEAFTARWSKVLAYLRVEDEAECLDRIRLEVRVRSGNDPLVPRDGDGALVLNDIHAAHDTYEEVALLFNDHTLEQETVIRAFGDTIAGVYVNSWWWVHYQRGCRDRPIAARWVRKRQALAYAEWERMVRTMVDRSPASRADFEEAWTRSPVRAICLPRHDDATLSEWRRAGRLSAAVGAVLREPNGDHDLESFLPAQLAPRPTIPQPFTPVERTVLLPPWPDLLTLPSRRLRIVVAAGAWWDQRREKAGGSASAFWLVRRDPWVSTCRRYQQLAWYLAACRDKLGDDDLLRRLRQRSEKANGAARESGSRGAPV